MHAKLFVNGFGLYVLCCVVAIPFLSAGETM